MQICKAFIQLQTLFVAPPSGEGGNCTLTDNTRLHVRAYKTHDHKGINNAKNVKLKLC